MATFRGTGYTGVVLTLPNAGSHDVLWTPLMATLIPLITSFTSDCGNGQRLVRELGFALLDGLLSQIVTVELAASLLFTTMSWTGVTSILPTDLQTVFMARLTWLCALSKMVVAVVTGHGTVGGCRWETIRRRVDVVRLRFLALAQLLTPVVTAVEALVALLRSMQTGVDLTLLDALEHTRGTPPGTVVEVPVTVVTGLGTGGGWETIRTRVAVVRLRSVALQQLSCFGFGVRSGIGLVESIMTSQNLPAVEFATLSTLATFFRAVKADILLALLKTSDHTRWAPAGTVTIPNLATPASRNESSGRFDR